MYVKPCQASYQHLTRGLATTDSGSRPASDDTVSKETTDQSTVSTESTTVKTASSSATTPTAVEKEDLVKKFKLKPSAEVGIRAGKREKQRKREQEEASRKAAEEESQTGANKIHRLFEKLQLGDADVSGASSRTAGASTGTGAGAGSTLGSKVSDSWKFLFDEDDLGEKKSKQATATTATTETAKETLDRIPGASDLFPNLSEYRLPTSGKSSNETSNPKVDRWKDPKLKSAEKDAFKALFSSLFEQKQSTQDSAAPGSRVQSLFSNFNRSGMDSSTDKTREEDSATTTLFDTIASKTATTPEVPAFTESPMQILNRQLFNLSKRVEPIYLEQKPKTSSFQAMESTVAGQEWLSGDASRPKSRNALFTAIEDENKVAIRMRNELTAKCGDVIKVKEFVDELIAPYVDPLTAASKKEPRPSSISLDGLLAQAITSASASSNIGVTMPSPRVLRSQEPSVLSTKPQRTLHPFMGHALVEHTRRQGLPVFIRLVRTESYKALIKSRWDTWRDGPGCLEILKEMQRSGALMDGDTLSLVKRMQRDLKESSVAVPLADNDKVQQRGWGDEEQAAPVAEMLRMVESEIGDRDDQSNMKHWARRADSSFIHR
ncbi:hypothetical protein BGZ95_008538 [Linnemannia exigua]|uniref:Mtf2-like C-terminal domain-containing protein n=1 Tax=Linnemannia exigua TaxID=604196 RepID=A0AAD4DEA6_9FUNG|nr:hypothetical protein BGZ95_008538 [Linnemannia exigua]